ncbi:MAG: MraZ [Geobacteraceae bacterium]|nr:MAG: MraZ [Geobacteraceae bacterium]
MFWGEHTATIDGKGRTSIPAKYREIFVEAFDDERFFITKCLVDMGNGEVGRGLTAYPYKEFIAFAGGLNKMGYSANQINAIQRLVVGPAVECSADKLGRVLIPPTLRSYAGLERDLVVIGMQNKIEIWSQESWDRVIRQAEKDYLSAADALAIPGI